MSSPNGTGPTLRITDCSDRELLTLLSELEATEGYVDVHDLAAQFWPRRMRDEGSAEAIHCRACVTRRLSWISREVGLVEKHDSERRRWRLTERGEEFLAAKLKAAEQRAIDGASEDALVELTARIGERYHRIGTTSAWLVRREWQYRTARR